MALSDWSCLAFGSNGKHCDGEFSLPNGTKIEIYKNWVYVRNENMWRDGCSDFVKPTIARIDSGESYIGGANIIAIRGPQHSIFVFASYRTNNGKNKYFAGIGCSAYDDPKNRIAKHLGVNLKAYDDVWMSTSYYTNEKQEDKTAVCLHCEKNEKSEYFECELTPELMHLESKLVGIKKSTYNSFVKWLAKTIKLDGAKDAIQWFKKLTATPAVYFNQGDAFFVGAKKAGQSLGKKSKPIAMQMIETIGA